MRNSRRILAVLLVGLAVTITVSCRTEAGEITYDVDFTNRTIGYIPQLPAADGPLNAVTFSGTLTESGYFVFPQPETVINYLAGPFEINAGVTTVNLPAFSGTEYVFPPEQLASLSVTEQISGSITPSSGFLGNGQIGFFGGGPMTVDGASAQFGEISGFDLGITYWFKDSFPPQTAIAPEPASIVMALISSALPICLLVRKRPVKRTGCV
jgi:hypothetical protein